MANDRPVTGTPTLFLDGELVDISELITGESFDPEKLRALDRGGGMIDLAYIPSPSRGEWFLGPIPIRGYAFAIILGVIAAIWIAERRWVAAAVGQGRPATSRCGRCRSG